jgi:uncharacterized glyoxalase superfamily protein PhnB
MMKCISFLRVPDITATITWYEAIGFTCLGTHQEPGCELDWALLDMGGARFMLYPEGREGAGVRDAGLYFYMEAIDEISEILKKHGAAIIEITEQTPYGRKEVTFNDINGFQVTFSCESGGK